MSELNVHLQEGFERDEVVVRVNAGEAFHKRDVTTRTQLGLADTLVLDVPAPSAAVEIEVPSRGASATFRVAVDDAPWVGVSIEPGGRITHVTSRQPFYYA